MNPSFTDKTRELLGRSPLLFVFFAGFAAFATYTSMYAFRKAFTVATYEGHQFLHIDYKIWLITAQVIGYIISKGIGIKIVAEMPPEKRARSILMLIGFAGLALLGFALVPPPYGIVFLFLNGLPLGMIFGIVFGFIEGRKLTDLLVIGLMLTFIFSSGLVKSIGKFLMDQGQVPEYWMPAATGGLFIPILCLSVWMLTALPPPSAEDVAAKTKRDTMNGDERRKFLRTFAPGWICFVIAYLLLTILRDFRDNFTIEIWRDISPGGVNAADLTKTEIPIALIHPPHRRFPLGQKQLHRLCHRPPRRHRRRPARRPLDPALSRRLPLSLLVDQPRRHGPVHGLRPVQQPLLRTPHRRLPLRQHRRLPDHHRRLLRLLRQSRYHPLQELRRQEYQLCRLLHQGLLHRLLRLHLLHARLAALLRQKIQEQDMAAASLSPATELEQRLESLLAARTAGRRDYAVFDWDNTCIVHDCQENLFGLMIDTLAFKIPIEHFGATLRRELPLLALTSSCRNSAGESVTLDALCRDLEDDYAFLRSPQCPMDFRATPQFLDFRVKLLYLYEAITLSYGNAIAYKWNIYFFSGFSPSELNQIARSSHQHFLREALETRHVISPEELPGQSGIVSVSHHHGLRISDEILRLIEILRQHQVDIFVNTASLEEIVAAFACDPRFGFGIPRDQVFGLRLEVNQGRFAPFYQQDWPMNWGPGKTEMIRRQIAGERGCGPLLVAGDSDGDYDMLCDFPDTRLGLIIRRGKGKIQQLGGERYWLQKRDPLSGAWLDSHG